jgi:hypothetical protein
MAVTATLYQVRAETIEQIERGRTQTLQCRVYDGGALVAPTEAGSTVSIYDASNTAIVDAAAVTVASSIATYSLAAATTSSLTRSEGWRIEWTLVMADATTRLIAQDAVLCSRRLLPPATAADLFRRVPSLDPSGDHPIHSMTAAEFDSFLDEAWVTIEASLISKGRRPWLIVSPQALREVHIVTALALIFESFATRLKPAYQEIAASYRQQLPAAWAEVRLTYDSDDDGTANGGANPQRVGASTTVWLSGRGSAAWGS